VWVLSLRLPRQRRIRNLPHAHYSSACALVVRRDVFSADAVNLWKASLFDPEVTQDNDVRRLRLNARPRLEVSRLGSCENQGTDGETKREANDVSKSLTHCRYLLGSSARNATVEGERIRHCIAWNVGASYSKSPAVTLCAGCPSSV